MSNSQIIDEAAEWFTTLRFDGADTGAQERFMEWLRISPEHVRAYLGVVALWSEVPAVAGQGVPDAPALIARARSETSVVTWDKPVPRFFRNQTRQATGWLAAAAIAVVCIGGTLYALRQTQMPVYSTAVGEQRSLRLPDGSKVELNSASRIRVRFSAQGRDIELLAGQALFNVTKDAQRPFVVMSDGAQVRAVGTAFDVYRKTGSRRETVVTVVEGRVAVLPPARAAGTPAIALSAGEQITLAPARELKAVPANVAAATAWRQGQLVFTSAPLSAVVEEFNRYNQRHLALEAGVEDFPITAVFASTDPDTLVEFLRDQPDIRVMERGATLWITRATQP
jgi:transmembrane sensor